MAFRYLKQREVTPELTEMAKTILNENRGKPWGTTIPFAYNGQFYVARIERHYHPPGGTLKPYGVHTGCSLGIDEDLASEPKPKEKFLLSKRSKHMLENVDVRLIKLVNYAIEITEVDFAVIEGRRTLERQKQLFAQGVTQTINSRHLTGHAVDLVPYVHNDISWAWGDFNRLAPFIFQAAEDLRIPIEWGGNWKPPHLKDGPHWQIPWGL